jgi:hypothetical protein
MDTIYVRLMGEGTEVYRPVSAQLVSSSIFVLGGQDTYNPDDEEWEFLPGAKVRVRDKDPQ